MKIFAFLKNENMSVNVIIDERHPQYAQRVILPVKDYLGVYSKLPPFLESKALVENEEFDELTDTFENPDYLICSVESLPWDFLADWYVTFAWNVEGSIKDL